MLNGSRCSWVGRILVGPGEIALWYIIHIMYTKFMPRYDSGLHNISNSRFFSPFCDTYDVIWHVKWYHIHTVKNWIWTSLSVFLRMYYVLHDFLIYWKRERCSYLFFDLCLVAFIQTSFCCLLHHRVTSWWNIHCYTYKILGWFWPIDYNQGQMLLSFKVKWQYCIDGCICLVRIFKIVFFWYMYL